MSYKQGHDTQGSYTDNIRVKISEKYKPPHRINLPMTYSQRLNLTKQILDSIPTYDFTLEQTVIEKMREWRALRVSLCEERKARLDVAKEEIKKRELMRREEEERLKEEQEVQTIENVVTTTNNSTYDVSSNMGTISSNTQNHIQSYSTNDSILMPTQASTNTYSNILTPIPLSSQMYSSKPADKSPFNISDFEDDTSSPFDNMELKSINDLEELAQVLKTDDSSHRLNNSQTFPTLQSTSQMQPSYTTYSGNQYAYIPNMMPYMGQPSDYTHTNGYYYPDSSRSFHQPYPYVKQNVIDNSYINSLQDTTKSNCKSVPDIMKALESELHNTHINYRVSNQADVTNSATESARPKSTDTVYSKPKIKSGDSEDIFSILPKSDQELCKSIGTMGFPTERVARTISLVGNDQKKIVEHLLALTDLLDLGFSEKAVINALLQCNNDRDKALDKLIS